jgi:hypothetical protein
LLNKIKGEVINYVHANRLINKKGQPGTRSSRLRRVRGSA